MATASVRALEEVANALHAGAAALNKEGRFEEAKAMYARYQEAQGKADEAVDRLGASVQHASSPPSAFAPDAVLALPSLSALPPSAGGADAVRRRMAGAIAGAALADAASMPLHWIYDVPKLTALVGDKDPAFFDPPSCPFYAYDAGRNTPYGDQAFTLLRSIVDAGGFSPRAYAEGNFSWFADKGYQADGGYLDGSTKGFLRNMRAGQLWPNCGSDDHQVNCMVRLAPIVAAFAGSPLMLPAVEDAIRVTQNDEIAVAWGCAAARVLEATILGASPATAVLATISALKAPWRAFKTPLDADIVAALEVAVEIADRPHMAAADMLGRN